MINHIFMQKIIPIICFITSLQFSDLIAAELKIMRSGDSVQYLGSQREIKLAVYVSTSNKELYLGQI